MESERDVKREKNLIKLMKIVGSLCEVVRKEKELLKKSGYSDQEIAEIEDRAGEAF